MIVVPYQAEHMARIRLQEAQTCNIGWMAPQHAVLLEGERSFSILDGDEVLFVGGVLHAWEGRGIAWCFLAADIGTRFTGVHRHVKRYFELMDYPRIEAQVQLYFEQAHRWMKMLGFELECPRARAFFPDGSDAAFYAKVK
jgi:hypothetical protein